MAGFRWRFLAPPLALAVVLVVLSLATGKHLVLFLLGAGAAILVAVAVAVAALNLRRRRPAPHSTGPAGDERPSRPMLVGREGEIDALVRLHDRIRRDRAETSMARPVVLLLCGVAGVGKSALAAAAAAAILARDSPYRTGPVTVNLNSGGEPVATGHVLSGLLQQMKWGGPIPPETASRVKLFRAFAAERRPIIVLDAVTDVAQVAGLIPNSTRCCVIVTSRRNLGPALGVEPYEVRPLRRSSSIELLHAITRTAPYAAMVCTDRLVDISGGLPVAIRAIGERVVFEDKSLCAIHTTLQPTRTRLQELTRGGAAVVDGIVEEFERLSPDESRALCLLTLLKTPTFASWVVAPLLDVPPFAGDRAVTELVNARLIEPVGRDRRLGLPRYRMNAIVRLYAESRLDSDAELLGECHVASRRLQAVFRMVGAQLIRHHPVDAAWPETVRQWIPKPRADRPAGADAAWLRAELLNLADVARGALADEPVLAWKLCGLFGENFPESGEHLSAAQWAADLTVTLDLAAKAAHQAGQPQAEIDVRLAEVNLHSGTGHFRHAEQVLERIESVAGGAPADVDRDQLCERAATAGLILAQGYLQAFQRDRARQTLERVGRLLTLQPSSRLIEREALLRAVAAGGVGRLPAGTDPALVAVVAAQQDAADDKELIPLLRALLSDDVTDLPRTVAIQYRLAQAYLRTFQINGDRPAEFLLLASHHAIRGVITSERMSDLVGIARGRCLLAETTAAAHYPDEARQHLDVARVQLTKMPELAATMGRELDRLELMVGPASISSGTAH